MSPDLERLVQLQQLESAAAEARGIIATHPQRLADVDTRLNNAKQRVEAAKERLAANTAARREADKNVALYQGRLTKFKEQAAAVKTNKEYQAIQHEIATAHSDLGNVEEKVLECMLEADAIAADVAAAEKVLASEQKAVDAERKALDAELGRVEASLATATEARAGLLQTVERRLLALFEQVAKVRKGVALCTATRDGLCSVCHVRLRPQVFQQVRTNDTIVQCESCHRILYYIPPPPPVEPPVVRTGPA